MAFKLSWVSLLKISLLLALIAAFIIACFTLPIEKVRFCNVGFTRFCLFTGFSSAFSVFDNTEGFLSMDTGRSWSMGPSSAVSAVLFAHCTVLENFNNLNLVEALMGCVLQSCCIHSFNGVGSSGFSTDAGRRLSLWLACGFIADSVGATIGAGAAFLLGRTIGRSYVISKLKDYPKFRAVAIAIRRSGFKIVLLLRLVPLLPFNMLNYLLSVTPVPIAQYMLASWLGMMPITFALVYVGTTLKDLSDVTHGWHDFSKTRWAFILIGLVVSVLLMICVTRVAKAALEKALAENEDVDADFLSPHLPIKAGPAVNLHDPLIIKIDTDEGIR
ncbi:UNVERIFIED_CONTAM: TVP38/TMEM64 family membrane protein [Sesamum radiatum]|uniref:TVP38/TMEM64 family membrane protein n=1 Tax=Sesamum radiatum TaxID=300843 RepID=A0AAW2S859_SESRA